jgi:cytidine deaminase
MKKDIKKQIEKILNTFPEECHDPLRDMIDNGAQLHSSDCKTILDILGTSLEQLMLRLLPLAKLYGIVPISNFHVGSVAKGISEAGQNDYSLYMGSNIEFPGQALDQSIHAEQAVVINAWQKGSIEIQLIAVSASPCGHCRQFLKELDNSDSINIISSTDKNKGYETRHLTDLLPFGFGPRDLKMLTGMMAKKTRRENFALKQKNDDPLVTEALNAANLSYAPYTGNLAGCAIQDSEEKIYIGRYAESAAFNPSMSPLQSAICSLNMEKIGNNPKVQRVVLVEKKTKGSQYHTSKQLLTSFAPNVNLEYFEVE